MTTAVSEYVAKGEVPKNEHSTPSVATAEIQRQILELKRGGMGFVAISQKLGYTDHRYVYKLYRKALNSIFAEEAQALRVMENERLSQLWREADEMSKAFTPLVSSGTVVMDYIRDANGEPVLNDEGGKTFVVLEDIGPRFKAIEVRLKIMERFARMNGLDLPSKIALTDPTGREAGSINVYIPGNSR